jgi:hypothetical protein
MDPTKLTDRQLYALHAGGKLRGAVMQAVAEEFRRRGFSDEHLGRLRSGHNLSPVTPPRKLGTAAKIGILLFPFFVPLRAIDASRFLSAGHEKAWKIYWRYISIGFALWTVLVVLLARFWLFRNQGRNRLLFQCLSFISCK